MTNRVPRYDGDGDDDIDNSAVQALVNFTSTESFSGYPLSNNDLTNSSVTVAGNSVSLGGSTGIAHGDLSSINSSDHHQKYTDEEAQDAVGLNFDGTLAYDDATPSFGVASGGITSTEIASAAVRTTEVDGSEGSSGQFLQTDGTSGGVTWGSPSAADAWNTSTITANTTASDNDELIADSSGGALTVTLPSPSNGVRVRAIRSASANGVTLARSGTENINGSASDLSISYLESVEVVSDGTDWWIV